MASSKKGKALVVGVAICLVVAAFVGGWTAHARLAGDFKTITLSSGREVILLRDIERVFPVYGKSVKAELDLALKQKAQVLEATQGGKFQSDVDKFYRDLDAINSDVRAALISGYSTLALKISVA